MDDSFTVSDEGASEEQTLHGKQATNPRRGVIREALASHGFISLGELQTRCKAENYGNVTRQMFHDDIAALSVILNWKLESTRDGGGGLAYRLQSAHHPLNKFQREQLNQVRKQQIADLLDILVTSDGHQLEDSTKTRGKHSIDKRKQKTSGLKSAENQMPQNSLSNKLYKPKVFIGRSIDQRLQTWWSSNHRKLAVDAGTTLETFVAQSLSKLRLPSISGSLCNLAVCTHNMAVLKELTNAAIHVQVIAVGGVFHKPTESTVGKLAEHFISSSGISFGMVLLGASCLDLAEMALGADSDVDAGIKLEYMKSCSGIKVAVVDETKFIEGSAGHHFFAGLNPLTVDLIVTDKISKLNLEKILAVGVPVLAANVN